MTKSVVFPENVDLSPRERNHFLSQVREMERQGFDFDGAEASLTVLARHFRANYRSPFEILEFESIVLNKGSAGPSSEAVIKVKVGEKTEKEISGGNGPVNALDRALRKALFVSYPEVTDILLRDYRVSILDGENGTASMVRVLIDFSDNKERWVTVGCSVNIIVASIQALKDGLEYKLA